MPGKQIKADIIGVCVDCLMYWGTGEEQSPEHTERYNNAPAMTIFDIDPESKHFSWSQCGICESPLGGDRYEAKVHIYGQWG